MVPFSSECGYRKKALAWLLERLDGAHVGHCPPPWRKAVAVQDAITRTTADILIVHDADVFTDGIPDAVAAVEAGAPWAVPHLNVHRLSPEATEQVYAGIDPAATRGRSQAPYKGYPGGGVVVLRRDVWDSTPMDPRFSGWGQEDEAWSMALTVCHGKPWRGVAPLFHLWHPEPIRKTRSIGSDESKALLNRYRRARRDPSAMRALVEEALLVSL